MNITYHNLSFLLFWVFKFSTVLFSLKKCAYLKSLINEVLISNNDIARLNNRQIFKFRGQDQIIFQETNTSLNIAAIFHWMWLFFLLLLAAYTLLLAPPCAQPLSAEEVQWLVSSEVSIPVCASYLSLHCAFSHIRVTPSWGGLSGLVLPLSGRVILPNSGNQ